jgi:hypothetical protein
VAALGEKSHESGRRGCRRETSFAGSERKRTFPNRLSGEEERFADVFGFQIRIERENLLGRLSFSNESDDRRDRDPKTTQAWHAPHLARDGRDPLEPIALDCSR